MRAMNTVRNSSNSKHRAGDERMGKSEMMRNDMILSADMCDGADDMRAESDIGACYLIFTDSPECVRDYVSAS